MKETTRGLSRYLVVDSAGAAGCLRAIVDISASAVLTKDHGGVWVCSTVLTLLEPQSRFGDKLLEN